MGNLRSFIDYTLASKIIGLPRIISTVKERHLTYLNNRSLYELHKTVKKIERESLPGLFLEMGCALGGSAIVICASKKKERILQIYDVFGMIPPPSSQDGEEVIKRYEVIKNGLSDGIDGNPYYGYEENLIDKVKDNFKQSGFPAFENNVTLVKGLFEDTLEINSPVAFAHIDGDWYESVKVCLERIVPFLVSGGTMVIDDYYHWAGCKKAVDEYFLNIDSKYIFEKKSRLHIIKK